MGFGPEHIIFDSNCRVKLAAKNRPWFLSRGLSVDVFHSGVHVALLQNSPEVPICGITKPAGISGISACF